MEIRKDLKSASIHLERLFEYSIVFNTNNIKHWSHLRNREDFDRIFNFSDEDRFDLEKIYSTGRDIAVYMSLQLQAFNYAAQYPTITSYINSFNDGWLYDFDNLKNISETAKTKVKILKSCPWAVHQMIRLFDEQINLLKVVKDTIENLKKTDIYKIENGIEPLKDNEGNVFNIGDISADRVNFSSTDNSINISNVSFDEVINDLSVALTQGVVDKENLDSILKELQDLKNSVNTPTYKERYSSFIQSAANHMAIVAPYIPALTKFLG